MIKKIRTISLAVLAAGMVCFVSEAAAKAPKMKHVVMIGSDGFSAEVIVKNPGKFPNLERMMKDGSYTMEARTVLPSSSAINWATLLMGAGSEMHGFTEWGSKTPEVEPPSPLTTLTIKVLQVRHPKRNPFLRPFWVLSFYPC